MLVRESRTSSAVLVIAVVATAVVLSAPVTTAVVPARAYARAQRGAAAALASSSVYPRPPTPAWRSHASSGLTAGPFPAAPRDSAPSAAPAPGQGRERCLSARQSEEQCFRDWVTSSSQAPASNW